MLTLQQTKDFLRVDGTAEDELITRMMTDAEDFLTDNVADHTVKLGNERYARKADSYMLLLIHDAYFNRSTVTEAAQKMTIRAQSVLCQLQYGNYPVVITP